jgi:hypothetical protein
MIKRLFSPSRSSYESKQRSILSGLVFGIVGLFPAIAIVILANSITVLSDLLRNVGVVFAIFFSSIHYFTAPETFLSIGIYVQRCEFLIAPPTFSLWNVLVYFGDLHQFAGGFAKYIDFIYIDIKPYICFKTGF